MELAGTDALHLAALAQPRIEMLEKMRILIDAGEGLHERCRVPRSLRMS